LANIEEFKNVILVGRVSERRERYFSSEKETDRFRRKVEKVEKETKSK
jgi:hypothetical protein